MNYLALGQRISAWLRDYLCESGLSCFVVGVSGGIDSAVASTLAAQTDAKTYALNLPIHSQSQNSRLADLHCRQLAARFANVEHLRQDFSQAYDAFMRAAEPAGPAHELAAANSKSRLRMMALYYWAGKCGGLVVGTGNKVEDFWRRLFHQVWRRRRGCQSDCRLGQDPSARAGPVPASLPGNHRRPAD